jgi:PAS domain S-box-containing protein
VLVSRDVTEQRRLEGAVSGYEAGVRDSDRLWATAFDRAPIGMSVLDLEGRWLRVNDAYCRMFGYERAELHDKTFADLTHPDDAAADREWMRRAAAGESTCLERDERCIARDGSVVWVHNRAEVICGDDGRPAYTLCLLQNITERRRSDLALQASERRMRSILDNTPGAVFVKGRDHRYQLVNRAFEQRFGAERGVILGRLDHEVLLPEVVALDRATDELVLRTGHPVEQEDVVPCDGEDRVFLTVKFPLREEGGEISAVCGIANDITDRRRREDELRDRLVWTDRIHAAVAHDRFVLYGQPIVNLASGEVEQAELLVRMVDHRGSQDLIPPAAFLPAAERFDLVAMIDLWVLARAVRLAAQGHCVEVNLSGKTISEPEHVAEIERLVVESGAPPENITFEITETAVARDMESARRFAERLRAVGCSFALDDFGVGFGAFTYLKHLSVDFLKIDIAFVRDLAGDESDRRVVESIVGVARVFGMRTIAEGVEDQATLELLAQLGVDYAQGYWIGRPAPLDELWPPDREIASTG